MSKQYFVNRRGKKLSVEPGGKAPNVLEPQLTAEQSGVTESSARASEKTLRERRPVTWRLRIPVRAVTIAVAAVVAGLVITAGILLIMADGARRDYDRQASALQSRIQNIATKPSSTETPAKTVTEGLLGELRTDDACTVSQPSELVDVFTPAREARDSCRQIYESYREVVDATQVMHELVLYLEEQHAVIAPALAPPANDAFAEIGSMSARWAETRAALQQIQPPQIAQTAHIALSDQVTTVADAWGGLAAAYAAQQPDAFTSAEASLTRAYEALRASHAGFSQLIGQQQTRLNQAVSKLRQ